MCGGTWIRVENQSQILTAAHCIMNSKKQLHSRLLVCFSWIVSNLPWKKSGIIQKNLLSNVGHNSILISYKWWAMIFRYQKHQQVHAGKYEKFEKLLHIQITARWTWSMTLPWFLYVFFLQSIHILIALCVLNLQNANMIYHQFYFLLFLSADVTIRCNQYIRSGSNSERKHSWLSAVLCWYEIVYKLMLLLNQSFGFNLIVYGSISYSVSEKLFLFPAGWGSTYV